MPHDRLRNGPHHCNCISCYPVKSGVGVDILFDSRVNITERMLDSFQIYMDDLDNIPSGVGERVLIVEDDPATRTRPGRARPGLGLSDRRGGRRRRGAAEGHHLPPGDHRQRPRDAADGRARAAARAEGSAVRHHVHPADRAGHGRERGRGDQGRRLRLSEQAGRSAAAADPAAEGGRAAGDAARGAAPAPPAARAGQLRPDHRQQPRHPHGLPRDRAGGADRGVGADLGRVGHRQGARRADDPRAEPARARSRSSRSTAPRFPRRCSRARSSGTRRARSPARTIAAPACSSWRIAARCSSTRSPR